METVKSLNLLKIVHAIVKRIDEEIIVHGEETAYIAYMIGKALGYSPKELYYLIVTAEIHDLGAYKTEKDKSLIDFDFSSPKFHSCYGYVLLKETAGFKNYASNVLYHHTSYINRNNPINNIPVPDDAFIISLADTLSLICNLSKYNKENILLRLSYLNKNFFNPKHIELLNNLIENENLLETIISGEYKKVLKSVLKEEFVNLDDALEYIALIPLAIDMFNYDTSIHTYSVSLISSMLSKKLNLDKYTTTMITIASYLHDLGKVATPKDILEKEGKLTDKEFEVMKNHVVTTREMLEDAEVNPELIDLACNHHEKLNGDGYPRGLDETSLTIADRVLSISDIFCALTEKRSYKKPFSEENIKGILIDMCTKNYIDKDITNVILDNCSEFIYSVNEYRDSYESRLYKLIHEYDKLIALY